MTETTLLCTTELNGVSLKLYRNNIMDSYYILKETEFSKRYTDCGTCIVTATTKLAIKVEKELGLR